MAFPMEISLPTRLEARFRWKFHFQRGWKSYFRWKFHFQRGWKSYFRWKFHFQRDWKPISGGNSISNAVGSPLRGREPISNVLNSKITDKNRTKMETMISLQQVEKIYRTKELETVALENVNLDVRKGEFLSIMGPSGCGKSTLLNIMGLLDLPSSGRVEIAGTDTSHMDDRALAAFRNEQLGFVFQSFHLISSLNVLDNVELPLLYRGGVSSKQRREAAVQVLEKVGLSHRMRHFPTQLSGGQCQRVAIARAIIGNPTIILADEPTGNLDSKMGAEVMEILHKLNQEDGRTIVMVTHNAQQAAQTSRTIRFFDGRQVE